MTATMLPRGTADALQRKLMPPEAQDVDPVRWVQGRLGEFLWSKQQEILTSVATHRKTAVHSAHQIGKSYIAARAGAWWIASHPPGQAMIVTSAPSQSQVRTILWGELARAHKRGNLPGYITRGQVPEWVIDGQVVGFGRKPADYSDENEARTQFQGIHARYLLVILDESCGVPKWLWEAADTLATNETSRILAIGNPDDPTSHFATVCGPASAWNVIGISAFDTPNFTGEPVPPEVASVLVSQLWVNDTARDYGTDSSYYIAKALGQFPDIADDGVISPRLIREAHQRDLSGKAIKDAGSFGMDVAEHGTDKTVIYRNRGGVIRLEAEWSDQDVHVSHMRTRNLLLKDRWRPIQIDEVAIGAGVIRPLQHSTDPPFIVTAFSGGKKAADPDRFANRNAEAWWSFREGLEAGLIDLDPEDLELAAQLQGRKWKLDSSQRRITVESKDDMKKRGLKSPDRADAAILSYYRGARTFDNVQDVVGRTTEPRTIAGDLLSLKT